MIVPGWLHGKGRALLASKDISSGSPILIEAPVLCSSRPGAVHACAWCLADASERCDVCDAGMCQQCGPHSCPKPCNEEQQARGSVWYRLYERYIHYLMHYDDINWSAYARVPTTLYEGWEKFAAAAHIFVQPLERRLRNQIQPGSAADKALTVEGFLDFYLLARANSAAIGDRGSAIFKVHACLNHSCAPNAVVLRLLDLPALVPKDGGDVHPASIIVFAKGDIPSHEEVCISYITEGEDSEELRRRYGFDCLCHQCALISLNNQGNEAQGEPLNGPLSSTYAINELQTANTSDTFSSDMRSQVSGKSHPHRATI